MQAANDYKPQSRLVVDNSTKKTYSAISFTTMQLPCFNEYRELFYDLNRKKIVPCCCLAAKPASKHT